MEVKEAIKSLGFIVEAGFGKMYKNEAESIIELLERGEVSRQIIEKMRNEKYDIWVSLPGGFISLADFISDIEEEVTGKNEIIEEVVEGITEQIKEGAEMAKEEVKGGNNKSTL